MNLNFKINIKKLRNRILKTKQLVMARISSPPREGGQEPVHHCQLGQHRGKYATRNDYIEENPGVDPIHIHALVPLFLFALRIKALVRNNFPCCASCGIALSGTKLLISSICP